MAFIIEKRIVVLQLCIVNKKLSTSLTKIKSFLRTNGKINFFQIKQISSLLGLNANIFKNINGAGDLKTNINIIFTYYNFHL